MKTTTCTPASLHCSPEQPPKPGITSALFVFFALTLFSAAGCAADLIVSWNAVSDARLSGYEVHYGEWSGQYQTSVTTTETTTTLSGLQRGKTYFAAVRSIGTDRALDSQFSAEVSATIPQSELSASFTLSAAEGVAPLTVDFESPAAGNIDTWSWDFDDGSTSDLRAPTHTFTTPGDYRVALMVRGPDGASTTPATALVRVSAPPPRAAFTANVTSGTVPLTVLFSAASSENATAWDWSFSDGGNSKAETAIYTFMLPGTYSVTLTASGAGGTDTVTKTELIRVTDLPPVADFDATNRIGPAPLVVVFRSLSLGNITEAEWDFGDGQTINGLSPSHSYSTPGVYSVTLTVQGPSGSHRITKSAFVEVQDDRSLPIEVGELSVDHTAQWVPFGREFQNPVVVANPPSFFDGEPATVRIFDVQPTGFRIRIQEWDYQDGRHAPETLHYVAMERGIHTLPTGGRVEAGTFTHRPAGKSFGRIGFSQRMKTVPVVLASVTTNTDQTAVTTALRNVTDKGFEVRLLAEESSRLAHRAETVSYIAWPTSAGEVDGLTYRVALTNKPSGSGHGGNGRGNGNGNGNRTKGEVSNVPYTLTLDADEELDLAFLAAMQTTNDTDPATLRYRDLTPDSVVIWAQEEQSRDRETLHKAESVGWMLFGSGSMTDQSQ